MVSSNFFYLIIIICLHTVIWFQVTNNYHNQSEVQVTILNTNNLDLYTSSIPIQY